MDYTYVIGRPRSEWGATATVKIGHSLRPEGRVKTFQTGHPHKLVVLAQHPNQGSLSERSLHQRFANFRTSGGTEWFELPDAELEVLLEEMEAARTELPILQVKERLPYCERCIFKRSKRGRHTSFPLWQRGTFKYCEKCVWRHPQTLYTLGSRVLPLLPRKNCIKDSDKLFYAHVAAPFTAVLTPFKPRVVLEPSKYDRDKHGFWDDAGTVGRVLILLEDLSDRHLAPHRGYWGIARGLEVPVWSPTIGTGFILRAAEHLPVANWMRCLPKAGQAFFLSKGGCRALDSQVMIEQLNPEE